MIAVSSSGWHCRIRRLLQTRSLHGTPRVPHGRWLERHTAAVQRSRAACQTGRHGPQQKELQQQHPARAGRGGGPRPRVQKPRSVQHARRGSKGPPQRRCGLRKWSSAVISLPDSHRGIAHPPKKFLGNGWLCTRGEEECPSPSRGAKSVKHVRVSLYRGSSEGTPKRRCDVLMPTQKVCRASIASHAALSVRSECSAWPRRQKTESRTRPLETASLNGVAGLHAAKEMGSATKPLRG